MAALKAAKTAEEKYGKESVVFTLSSGSTMQLTMENLPGHITTYYRMLSEEQKQQARYTVGYYWTDQDSLAAAAPENTYRVYTFAEAVPGGGQYSGFERVFGANIQVPNLINKVFVQKVDETNTRIDGATFGIYRVKQDEATGDGEIQYLTADGGYVSLSAAAKVGEDGVITDGDVTIHPLEIKITKTYDDDTHVGTCRIFQSGRMGSTSSKRSRLRQVTT